MKRPLSLFLCLAVGACGVEGERPDGIEATSSSNSAWIDGWGGAGSLGASRPKSYPDGPYGSGDPGVGERLPNLRLEGFVSPPSGRKATSSRYSSIELNDIRRSDNQFLIVHVSALWCPPCMLAARDLAENHELITSAGATVIELLVDGQSSGADPSREELEIWADTADLMFPTAMPGDEETRKVFPHREYAYLVDLDSMEVIFRTSGFQNETTVAQEAIDELLKIERVRD